MGKDSEQRMKPVDLTFDEVKALLEATNLAISTFQSGRTLTDSHLTEAGLTLVERDRQMVKTLESIQQKLHALQHQFRMA